MSRERFNMTQRQKDFLYGKRSFGKSGSMITVIAQVSRFSRKKVIAEGGRETWIQTLCLKDVKDLKGNKLTDHLWIDFPFEIRMNKNSKLRFTGKVREYTKLDAYLGGYRNNYEITDIRDIAVL